MAKPKPHNVTLDPDIFATYALVVLPNTRFRSMSAILNNELIKATRARLPELRKAKLTATPEQRAMIERAIEVATK